MLKKLSKMLGVALTIAMLTSLFAVASPASAITQPTVAYQAGHNVISKPAANMTVTFSIATQLVAGDTITITYPSGYTLGAPTVNVAAAPGWVGGTWQNAVVAGITWVQNNTTKTLVGTLGVGDQIGETAQIRVNITAGITNPAEIGDYTVTVATSKEVAPVTSASFSIAAPTVPALPGIVEVYNPANVLMASYTGAGAIQAAINVANTAGSVVKIGAGTYTENPNVNVIGGVTITKADSAATADVIVQGVWTFSVASASAVYPNTTLTGLTLRPAAAGAKVIDILGTANNTSITNNVITKAVVAPNAQVGAASLIAINTGASNHAAIISGNSIDSTDGAVNDCAILVGDGPVTVSGNTFMVDATLAGVDDVAIDLAAGANALTIDNNTFTGASGIGYRANVAVASATVAITNNTFTGLAKAIFENNGALGSMLTVTNNMITGGTVLATATAATATAAVDLTNARKVSMQKNEIKDNNGYAIVVGTASNTSDILMIGNVIMGNVYGTANKDLAVTLVAELNYWGDNSGPTIAANPGGTGDPIVAASAGTYGTVDYTPWSNTSTTEVAASQSVLANGTLDKSTTVGIAYSATAAITGISLMKYSSNPAPVEPPAAALDGGYYDVYSPNAALVGAAGSTTVMFFNANINADTKVYYYSALQKEWVLCSEQAVAGNGAYAYIVIKNTGSSPTSTELNGTVFALVDKKTIPASPVIVKPVVGDVDVTIAPLFTWNMVVGAVDYEVVVSADPSFTFVDFKAATTNGQTFYKHTADLEYGETYYWKVSAKLADGTMTAASNGIFSTEMEPAVVGDDGGITVTVPPIEIPEITIPEIVVPDNGGSIPTYILWIIVVIGAVLVIALIVLIVRTRRVN